jgi:hypothetical protein
LKTHRLFPPDSEKDLLTNSTSKNATFHSL